jgi:hypothetical protein
MDIVQYISTPTNTTEIAPLVTTIKLTKGRLTGGIIYFPSGPAGKLHFIARMGVHQVVPFNTGQNLRLDDCVFPFSLGFDLVEPPFDLICETWNDSTLYAHVLTVVINIEPMLDADHDIKTLINKFWYYGGRETT